MWTKETCYPTDQGTVISFESYQFYVEKLMKELEEILIAFPVIAIQLISNEVL